MTYTVRELARMLDISESCVRSWVHKGRIETEKDYETLFGMGFGSSNIVKFLNSNPKYLRKLHKTMDPKCLRYSKLAEEFYKYNHDELKEADSNE